MPKSDKPSWTPGPWRIEYMPYIHVRSDAGCVLAADYTSSANAALISAAPDLYEALCGLVGPTPQMPNAHALIRAHEALAKAEDHL